MAPFVPKQHRQIFCSPAHKSDFHNRATVRGRQLTPLVMAEREGRGGDRRYPDADTAIYARQESRSLIARWASEDKAAGRMSMLRYAALRRRLGYDVLL